MGVDESSGPRGVFYSVLEWKCWLAEAEFFLVFEAWLIKPLFMVPLMVMVKDKIAPQ